MARGAVLPTARRSTRLSYAGTSEEVGFTERLIRVFKRFAGKSVRGLRLWLEQRFGRVEKGGA